MDIIAGVHHILQRVFSCCDVCVILIGRKLGKLPLVAFVVVVVHPIIDDAFHITKSLALAQVDFVFHVPEEALLRGVVPTVRFS